MAKRLSYPSIVPGPQGSDDRSVTASRSMSPYQRRLDIHRFRAPLPLLPHHTEPPREMSHSHPARTDTLSTTTGLTSSATSSNTAPLPGLGTMLGRSPRSGGRVPLPSIAELRLDLGVDEYERYQQARAFSAHPLPSSNTTSSTWASPVQPTHPRSSYYDHDFHAPISTTTSPHAPFHSPGSPHDTRTISYTHSSIIPAHAQHPSGGISYTHSGPLPLHMRSSSRPRYPTNISSPPPLEPMSPIPLSSNRSLPPSSIPPRPATAASMHHPSSSSSQQGTISDAEQPARRKRRKYDEIERKFVCNWHGCTKGYAMLQVRVLQDGTRSVPQANSNCLACRV